MFGPLDNNLPDPEGDEFFRCLFEAAPPSVNAGAEALDEDDYELIAAYLEGKLDGESNELFRQRLTEEPELRAAVAEFLRNARGDEYGDALFAAMEPVGAPWWRPIASVATLAAGIVLALNALLVGLSGTNKYEPRPTSSPNNTLPGGNHASPLDVERRRPRLGFDDEHEDV